MTCALIELIRRRPVDDHEESVLSTALRLLDQRHTGPAAPLLGDLVALLEQGPDELQAITLARGDMTRYRADIDPLQKSVQALLEDGPFGATFARPTSEPLQLDAPAVCVDISAIPPSEAKLRAAVMLTCWNDGFAAVEASHTLADAGAIPQRRYYTVLDELWRVLAGGGSEGLVDRVNEITRLNRTDALGTAMITHSLADLRVLSREEDRAKAGGFVERSGMVVCGGLPPKEVDELAGVVPMSQAERDEVTSWSAPAALDTETNHEERPPGQGKFLIKVGQRPGIPIEVLLTPAEQHTGIHDTNQRWRG